MGFENLPDIAEGLGRVAGSVGLISSRIAALPSLEQIRADIEAIRRIHRTEPSAELNVQTPAYLASLSPEAQQRALRGEVPPGFSRGPATALLGTPGPPWGELFTVADILRTRGQAGPSDLERGEELADRLQAFIDRILEEFPESYFAKLLEEEIPFIRAGARSPEFISDFLRNLAPAFLPGLQQALLEPSITATVRNLIQEAIRSLMTGIVPGPPPTFGPRPAPAPTGPAETTTAARTVTAGIGVPANFATREDVAGLRSVVVESGEQTAERTADRVIAGVARYTEETTRAVVERSDELREEIAREREAARAADRALAEQFAETRGWARASAESNRTLADQFRGWRQESASDRRALADQFRQFGQSQLRIEGSVRALGRNVLSPTDLRNELERLVISGRLGVA
jgi:hypothetical protein